MNKIIITGSRGLIGSELVKYLKNSNEILELDLSLGHDLTDEKFVEDWFSKNQAQYLVNCFAINDHVDGKNQGNNLFDINLSEISEFLDVNVISLFSVCRHFAKQEKPRAITNFSSTYGVVSPIPGLYENGQKHIGYSISKGAVMQLTRHLAVHLAPKIRVNCLIPGGVELNQSDEFINKYSSKTPLGRMMRKDELNGIIEFLCSEKSSYVTGTAFKIDGGWTSI